VKTRKGLKITNETESANAADSLQCSTGEWKYTANPLRRETLSYMGELY
jgi:hypothetical protein